MIDLKLLRPICPLCKGFVDALEYECNAPHVHAYHLKCYTELREFLDSKELKNQYD